MSEELLQTIPHQIGKFTYYRLGSTTLAQLRNNGLIPKRKYKGLERKKPDGLVKHQASIKAVVEYKLPEELGTEKQIEKAIKQEIDVAKALCKILIVTDGSKSFWINALNGQRIKDRHGNIIRTIFHPFTVTNANTLEYLINEIDASISKSSSIIRNARLVDPSPLATRLWQTIWVATGKSPVKCLYNVVELFIFKFLSDLRVLDDDISFNRIYEKSIQDSEESLQFYARNSRKKILSLFPPGEDGTTIINGTIFVDDQGKPNLSQSILFARSLAHLHKYTEEFGSLTKIDKQFKTKLYESFMKQEVQALGQYFTPRKLIQSVIRMGGLDSPNFQFRGKRIVDPFCGVGGFPLELLNMNEAMKAHYAPDSQGRITLPFVLHGFDKGFERDDERTIILAKANMLIYLAELLFDNPSCSGAFSRVFNKTFKLFRDNLGTFGFILNDEEEKYDLILSNPPYVTRGSSIIKEEIKMTPRTANYYPVNALGLEGLSLEWIVKSLRPGGRAFVIIPDGLLGRVGERKLRSHILEHCYLDAIVSLPVRTFFANYERTYVFVLTKKHHETDQQSDPVFTYLVSNIGERLTSVKREDIPEDDLPEMERLFKFFSSDKRNSGVALKPYKRCKIYDIEHFQGSSHWVIDRWWSHEELIEIGAVKGNGDVTKEDVAAAIKRLSKALNAYERLQASNPLSGIGTAEVPLGDESIFSLFIGKRVLKKDISTDETLVPVYSANVQEPMGYIEESNIETFDFPMVLWGIDGDFDFNVVPAGRVLATTDHCGAVQIKSPSIVPEYLLYAMTRKKIEESFDRSFRASLTNMRMFTVCIPMTKSGTFDVTVQKKIADRFRRETDQIAEVQRCKAEVDELMSQYVGSGHAK